ncbi:hypothetical protein T440DRAFT_464498 [Plenodomus tracheiphilus IPT5]|uniref:Fungal N-terminal domain-containing protein n=1 Tax=Plenodomus tracheiphilus IPT5 TaxID=1408161 RepID=A0A6A7BKB0_9PLEO|nr:hypothetical protein T440DRAFT_464498 [Plenodomus tracheiphilus IPT5]
MTDSLSLAASVVGITAAGVRASIKLYALAEKVATASERVNSIANDISSTCAILNGIRTLITPCSNADGTPQSVFNSAALVDIAKALSRCEVVFKEVESYHTHAFKQAKSSSSLNTKISLSWRQRAKWPFLQPHFDDIRNDLRDAKNILMLMISVATLALTAGHSQKRAVDTNERMEMENVIVQLQRAQLTPKNKEAIGTLGGQKCSSSSTLQTPVTSVSANTYGVETPHSEPAAETNLEVSGWRNQNTTTFAASPRDVQNVLPNVPIAYTSAKRSRSNLEHSVNSGIPNTGITADNSYADNNHIGEKRKAQPLGNGPFAIARKPVSSALSTATGPSLMQSNIAPDVLSTCITYPTPIEDQGAFDSAATRLVSKTGASNRDSHTALREKYGKLRAWTTSHLRGLEDGEGDSLQLQEMLLPQNLLHTMTTSFIKERNFYNPELAIQKLNRFQFRMVYKHWAGFEKYTLLYINPHHTTTVSSIFGDLSVVSLLWIVLDETPRPEDAHSLTYWPTAQPSSDKPSIRPSLYEIPWGPLLESSHKVAATVPSPHFHDSSSPTTQPLRLPRTVSIEDATENSFVEQDRFLLPEYPGFHDQLPIQQAKYATFNNPLPIQQEEYPEFPYQLPIRQDDAENITPISGAADREIVAELMKKWIVSVS